MRIITLAVLNNAKIKTFLKAAQRESFFSIIINKINLQLHSRSTSTPFSIWFSLEIPPELKIPLLICMGKKKFCLWVPMRILPILSIGQQNMLGFVVLNGGSHSLLGRR